MAGCEETTDTVEVNIPQRLDDTEADLLIAQTRLASIEGDVPFEDLIFIRRLIGVAFEQLKAMRSTMLH